MGLDELNYDSICNDSEAAEEEEVAEEEEEVVEVTKASMRLSRSRTANYNWNESNEDYVLGENHGILQQHRGRAIKSYARLSWASLCHLS